MFQKHVKRKSIGYILLDNVSNNLLAIFFLIFSIIKDRELLCFFDINCYILNLLALNQKII